MPGDQSAYSQSPSLSLLAMVRDYIPQLYYPKHNTDCEDDEGIQESFRKECEEENGDDENKEGITKNSALPQPISSGVIISGNCETNLDCNRQLSRTRLKYAPEWSKFDIAWETIYYFRHVNWKKRVVGITFLTLSISVLLDVIFSNNSRTFIYEFIQWMNTNILVGTLFFSVLFVITTLTFIPSSIMVFGGSFVYADICGFFLGIIFSIFLSFACSCIGAILAFLQSKYMTRDLTLIYTNRFAFLRAADNVLKTKGLRILILLRLSPFIPFTAINYVAGTTGITIRTFLKSMIGQVPIIITMVIMGATANSSIMPAIAFSVEKGGTNEIYVYNMINILNLAISIVFGISAIIILWHMAKIELERVIDDSDGIISQDPGEADSISKSSVITISTDISRIAMSTGSTTSSTENQDKSVV